MGHYEKEWRVIPNHPKIERKCELSYIECTPLAVIIGSQCQRENRTGLIGLCRDAKIPVFGIFLSETDARFKLNINDEETIDMLALHLGFYLASWGMYRGSSFLLQKDYKVHVPIVKIIINNENDFLVYKMML